MKKLILIIAFTVLTVGQAYGDSAISYTSNTSPVETDQLLGIDDPGGTWSINRFPISNLWTSIFKGYADALYLVAADVDTWAEHPALAENSVLVGNGSNQPAAVALDDTPEDSSAKPASSKAVYDERAASVTLTNKTIDGDDNTIQDIGYGSIKSTSRSGSDVTLVTGTEGDANDILIWDANGDAISSGEALSEVVTAARVGGVSANLDDTDASIEWEDADDLDSSGAISDNAVDYAATSGSYKVLTPVLDAAADFSTTFTGANLYGGTFICDTAGTAALPAVTAGMGFTVIIKGDVASVFNPDNTGTEDTIILVTPSLGFSTESQGENIDSGTDGSIAVFQYYAADTWLVIADDNWTGE